MVYFSNYLRKLYKIAKQLKNSTEEFEASFYQEFKNKIEDLYDYETKDYSVSDFQKALFVHLTDDVLENYSIKEKEDLYLNLDEKALNISNRVFQSRKDFLIFHNGQQINLLQVYGLNNPELLEMFLKYVFEKVAIDPFTEDPIENLIEEVNNERFEDQVEGKLFRSFIHRILDLFKHIKQIATNLKSAMQEILPPLFTKVEARGGFPENLRPKLQKFINLLTKKKIADKIWLFEEVLQNLPKSVT